MTNIPTLPKALPTTLSLVLLCLFFITACTFTVQPPNPAADTPITSEPTTHTISGNLTRGESYTATLTADLMLQLLPTPHGWEIWLGDPVHSTAPADNFAMPVTPPFHTINARQLDGWHFRNRDNTGPNAAGDNNVNAPQAQRDFCFVATHADFTAAHTAFANGLPALSEAIANNTFAAHPGTLTITDYTLGNLIANDQAWFETIDFTVTINLDQPCPLF